MTREEAITMLYGIQADNLNLDDAFTKDKYDALTMAIKALEEPKTWHWNYTDAYPHWVCCDKCKTRFIPNKEWIKAYNIPTNYCPNCGAKMESEVVEDA